MAEALKDSNSGYAEAAYLNNKQNGFSTSGANVVLNYLRNHAYNTADTRPNTDEDVYKRQVTNCDCTGGAVGEFLYKLISKVEDV